MKRFPILGALLLIPAIALLGLVGCTSNKDKDKAKDKDKVKDSAPDKDKDKDKDKTGGKKKKTEIATALEATVSGTVKFKGKAPTAAKIAAIATHSDKETCMMGDDKEQVWHVNNDGLVANVVIFMAPAADKKFSAKVKDLVKVKEVVLDQPFCQYVPHVVGLYPDAQTLVAKNSAKVIHNVKIPGFGEQGNVNVNQKPGQSDKLPLTGVSNETLLAAECSVHSWMNAKITVFNHPYFAVTDDKGAFKIENVPVDEELTVYMWHESMGGLNNKSEQKKMSFKKGDNSLGELSISK